MVLRVMFWRRELRVSGVRFMVNGFVEGEVVVVVVKVLLSGVRAIIVLFCAPRTPASTFPNAELSPHPSLVIRSPILELSSPVSTSTGQIAGIAVYSPARYETIVSITTMRFQSR